jgi:putative peptide zinc metalloprotease protein
MRRLTIILIAGLVALALAGPLAGVAAAQDNTAVAINTKDGTSIFKLAFKIHRVAGEVVDNSNAAVAFASCEECQALAVAMQVVLVFSDPAVVTPENIALAVNYECTSCVAFASAFQWVLGTGGAVHFTPEGNKRLAEVRKWLHDLRKADLTLEQLVAELEAIQQEVAEILDTQLVPAGKPDEQPPPSGGGAGTETGPADTTTEPQETTSEPTTTEETPTTTTTTTP